MMYDTLFLDRDGVLNRKIDGGYVLTPEDIEILPGIPLFLKWAHQTFRRIIVVTNQRCIGRGMISLADIQVINQAIDNKTGNYISKFFVCPHLDEDNCCCRKPKKGLFLAAAEHYVINFQKSWMIGDSETDLIPAKELSMSTVFISGKDSIFADQTIPLTADLLRTFKSLTQTK
ncbi:D-alpha,beta-D-heptose 1,7-bisphosphate phosphatase [Arcticibacter pallidicorallinus]|uniref:D,D-heptose 1,7-bisphosphate phosphatase n=1 Tax=Arcticibacter pallidicorallinus TaxID=1259464 RepID=A0A2T0UBW6_9SPHI|nr:HAD-IIIA family hydrolase [Arcticibacter pallidicorallinus]PRY55307.1 D-alpha,beta-D-heptose 1,7-bisphosphate phosphatase [Arcticibacter pallidicorallinus]